MSANLRAVDSLFGEIALAAQEIPPVSTHFSIAWSVCLCVCRLSHSCTLLKPFDGFRRHLAGTLMGSNDTLCHMGSLTLQEKEITVCGGGTPSQNMQLQIAARQSVLCCHLSNTKRVIPLFAKLLIPLVTSRIAICWIRCLACHFHTCGSHAILFSVLFSFYRTHRHRSRINGAQHRPTRCQLSSITCLSLL